MHPYQHHIDLCNRALEAVRPLLPDDLYWSVHGYINSFDEWGLGIEILIDQISEFEIKITPEQFGMIHVAMASLGLENSDRMNYLRDHDVVA